MITPKTHFQDNCTRSRRLKVKSPYQTLETIKLVLTNIALIIGVLATSYIALYFYLAVTPNI